MTTPESVEINFDAVSGATTSVSMINGHDMEFVTVHNNNNSPFFAFGADMNPYAVKQEQDEEAASVCPSEKEELHEDKVLPQGDEHGRPVEFPHPHQHHQHQHHDNHHHHDDEEDPKMDGLDKKKNKSVDECDIQDKTDDEAPHSVLGSGIESIKYLYSTALLIFSVVLVMGAIFTEQTTATSTMNVHPAAACFLFWFLLAWLAMMEGGQGALVGLQPIDRDLYFDSHPKAAQTTELAHKGDNMERFIVGRQFLVVLVVFLINMMASAVPGATLWNMDQGLLDVFFGSGLAVIIITITIGQLTSQVNAANCMLDFINTYFMLITTYISLAIEFSGLLHCVYLVQIIFAKLTKTPMIESKEAPRTILQTAFFWFRILLSLAILGFAFAVTLSALFKGQTTMWDGVPEAVSIILFFALMCLVGMMEGMQIALFAVVNLPEEQIQQHKTAHYNCQLTFSGQNLQAFLIGRQICVTVCMFVVARITTLNVSEDEETIFGVSPGLQAFFNTGLLGAVITTIVASLAWRIIASSFPVAFLSNPLIYIIIRLCLILEKSGVCSSAWVLARYQKILAAYQPDEVHLEGAEPHEPSEPVTRRDKDIDRMVTIIKFTYSLALLAFAVVLVMAAIFDEQTVGTSEMGIHPALAFCAFWFLICWLAMMEGGQGALVGLQPIDQERYAETHPRTLLNTKLVHKGDNMERFIVGRQFLVVLVVFVTNLMASCIPNASVLGLPDVVNEIFLATGLALILTTIMIGQLMAQVNAANCMLDFLNNYFMLFTTYVSLGIEMSGLLHSVYLVQILFSKITRTPIESKEPPRTVIQNVFFWARVMMSLIILGFALAVPLSALFAGQTTMWQGIPNAVSVIIFFVLMCFVGLMEGMQIALFAVVNLPEEKIAHHAIAYANCQLTFAGHNLQAFLIGRQICVTICMFVVARITTIDVAEGEANIFGVSDGLQNFFNTGLLGAVITTIVGSLAWRIIASSFPVTFLSNPLIYLIIRLCLLLEESGVCSAAWVLGRWNKLMVGLQPDEVYLEAAEPQGRDPVTRRDKDIDVTVTVLKYGYSMALLVFCVTVVMAAIFTKQTTIAESVHPLFAFFVLWGLIVWLAMMEGGQGALVGLQPIEKELYAASHPVSYKCTRLAHKGDNMERFIVGRQFLVVLVVFVVNMCGAAIPNASVFGFPDIMNEIFLASGVALMLTTIILGQLTAQVNAANCMLDFINTYFMLFTTYVSLGIEFSGLLHCVYLVQIFFFKITGKATESEEPSRTTVQNAFFWSRVIISLAILGFAFAVTLSALFNGKTTMWEGIPPYVSVIIFFVLMCLVGLMEGMQIALFAVVNMNEEELHQHAVAYTNCQLTFAGKNFQAFLIGRQICVTVCMFVVARITTLNVEEGEETIFGVPAGVQAFFNTGLLGALITTIVASLAWRVIASSFPVAFMSNPLIYLIIRLCLMLEASGICSAAWLLALVHKQLFGYQLDEVYVGTAEDRENGTDDFDFDEDDFEDLELRVDEMDNDDDADADAEVPSSPSI